MYVYKTTNIVTGKIYIGKCQKSVEKSTNYLGSGKAINASIKKHGRNKFTKEILQICESIEELFEAEKEWVIKLNSTDPKIGYNIMIPTGHSWCAYKETNPKKYESIKKKLSESVKKSYINNPSLRKQRSETLHSKESNKKRSISLFRHEVSKAAREKLRQANLGKKYSQKVNKSKGLPGEKNPFYGKTHSKETIKKILETRGSYEGEKNPFFGKTHSEKTRKILSLQNSLQAARRHGDLPKIELLESELSSLRSS